LNPVISQKESWVDNHQAPLKFASKHHPEGEKKGHSKSEKAEGDKSEKIGHQNRRGFETDSL